MRPAYLANDRLYLRPLGKEDARVAVAWHPGPLPTNTPAAEAFLKDKHSTAWGPSDPLYLAVVRADRDRVVGGVEIEHPRGPAVAAIVRTAPALADEEADEIVADALRLLVPWLRDEVEAMVVTVPIAADRPRSIAAAEELEMIRGTRLRGFVARAGHRVDLLEYQALNPRRAVGDDPRG